MRGVCRDGRGDDMWTHPLGPLVELPGWHVRRNGRGDAIWTHPLGPLVERPGGHETCEGCAEMGAGSPCGRTRWGHMWSHNEGVPPVLISVLVNFQREFAAAPSVLLGRRGTSIYLRIPPPAPSHRCVCAISVYLSAPPGRRRTLGLASLVASIYVSIRATPGRRRTGAFLYTISSVCASI